MTADGSYIEPRSATASTETAFGMPLAHSRVPSIGSTATSQAGPVPSPTSSPLYSIGALSFSPSPMTTTPRMDTELMSLRMAFTAAPSAPFLSPRPTQRAAAIAAASVTRASSSARFRVGACWGGSSAPGMPVSRGGAICSSVMCPFLPTALACRAYGSAPARPGLVQRAGERLGSLCPGHAERHVDREERDAADAELARLQLVPADRVGVRVAAEHLLDGRRVQPGADRYAGEHVRVEDLPGLREVSLADGGDQLALHAFFPAKVDHPVDVEGVARRAVRAEAQPLGPGEPRHPRVGRARLCFRHAVLPGEHARDGFPLAFRAFGVQLEGAVHHLNLVAAGETGEGLLEPGHTDIAPRADDIAPDIHAHAFSVDARVRVPRAGAPPACGCLRRGCWGCRARPRVRRRARPRARTRPGRGPPWRRSAWPGRHLATRRRSRPASPRAPRDRGTAPG